MKNDSLTSKTSGPVEGLGLVCQEKLSSVAEEIDHSPSTKRARLSSSTGKTQMKDLRTLLLCEQCPDESEFFEVNELSRHEKEIHQSYQCLFCDKTLIGERKLSEHLQTSLKLQQANQPNNECKRSENRAVKMICSFCTTYALSGVSLNHYELITRHIKISHPSQQGDGLTVQIGSFSSRPLTDVEITYLKSAETSSFPPTQWTPTKRRNVAVKSTARPLSNSPEPPRKLMYLDGSAITTIPNAESSSIIKASDGSTIGLLVTSFGPTTNDNDLNLSAST